MARSDWKRTGAGWMRRDETVLTEAIDGLHKGQFILWTKDGQVIRVGTRDFAKYGASLSLPSPRQG